MTVDLRELAIDRSGSSRPRLRNPRRLLTRYVLPSALVLGFLSLLAWAARDFVFPPTPVTVVPVLATSTEVQQQGIPLFKAAGWVEPRPTPVRVAALAAGVVEQLLVVEDQPVQAGQRIAELVKDDAKLAHDRALADLELRQAELDQARAVRIAADTRIQQPVHLQAALGDAEAALARIETQLKNLPFAARRAAADHEAMQKDYAGKQAASGVVAGIEIDLARSKAASSQALVEELRDRLQSLEKERAALTQRRDALKQELDLLTDEIEGKGAADAQVRAATARVAQARVALAQASLQLKRMTIVSPIEGRVYRLIAHPGARIGGGSTQTMDHDGSTVVTLYRPDRLQLRVDVRFQDIPRVSLNQQVEINNATLSSPLIGRVLFISSEADIQKNTLQVKVEIPDPPAVFKPEMLVDVTFLSQASSEAAGQQDASPTGSQQARRIFVPQQLVWQESGASYVWLADQSEGVARKQLIQTQSSGRRGFVEVTSGLTVSSRIVDAGSDELSDGCRIRVTGESAPASMP